METYSKEDVDYASWSLSKWIYSAIETNDVEQINAIRSLWDNESWDSIVRKINYDDSTWVVWWYDGLRQYLKIGFSDKA